ncbi:DUF1203 domain-containing protein [Flavobacterium sp. N2038]|uniref:DUF1203 domain-containing protein n=1 Tax=Flavobacterium sp. N2038 TaxID=2986829 RepID=UPI002223F928|nr:DUF1203 domain-containing protein [Flavobacterium sp. N2038]
MKANFKIKPLNHMEFSGFFELTNLELEKIGAVKMTVDKFPGFPCRISLEDAEIGEEVILLPYKHHKTNSPYQSSGPIFIRKRAFTPIFETNQIPLMLNHRLLSLRGYDENGMMKEASVIEGITLKESISKIFENEKINYIHIHNARPGCYNCLVERA